MVVEQIVKNFSIKYISIMPCKRGIQNCRCVNYLNFTNKYHYNLYKKCLKRNNK